MKKYFKIGILFLIITLFSNTYAQTKKYIVVGNPNYSPTYITKTSEKKITSPIPNSYSLIISLNLLLTTALLIYYKKTLPEISSAYFSNTAFFRVYYEKNAYFELALNIFDKLYLFNISLIIWLNLLFLKINTYNILKINNFSFLFVLFSALLIWKLFKSIISKYLAFIFESEFLKDTFIFRNKISNSFMSTFLPFLIFIGTYQTLLNPLTFIKLSYFLLVANFMLRTYFQLAVFIKKHFSLLIVILYLCTIEILPVLIVIELVVNKLQIKLI